MSRTCALCFHDEMEHWGRECSSQHDIQEVYLQMGLDRCGCKGFWARMPTKEELKVLYEMLKPKEMEFDGDDYSEFKEHIAKVLTE